MAHKDQQLAEKKLLLAMCSAEVFEGKIIEQLRPSCCGKEVDLLEARLTFRDVQIHNRVFTLIEPYCLFCGKKVHAVFNVIN